MKAALQLLAVIALAIFTVSCEHSLAHKGADGSITISDGSAASRVKGHQEIIIDVPGFGTVTKRTWDRDQTAVLKSSLMWSGVPKVMSAGGEMTKDIATGVGTVIKK